MSCTNCDDKPIRGAFYRRGTANVEIIACREHWLQIKEALDKAQTPPTNEEGDEETKV